MSISITVLPVVVYTSITTNDLLTSLPLLPSRQNPSHHLLLRDEMVNPLQQPKQTLHVTAPLIQHIVRIARLSKVDQPRRTINLRMDGLRRYQLADVLLRLLLRQIEQLRQPAHLDARIVLRDDADVVLDHAFPQILPAAVGLVISSLTWLRTEDISLAELRAELLGHHGPAHQLVDRKQLDEAGFDGDSRQSGVLLHAVQEIRLFVVVGGKNNVIDNPGKDLSSHPSASSPPVIPIVREEEHTARSCSGLFSTDSVSSTSR